ncbi:prefoldin subunit 2-like [Glandiceps talaboti]
MASDGSKKSGNKASKPVSQENIVAGFNLLRQEQRQLASKIAELEAEQHEHRAVYETLQEVDGDRRCFRLVGGVLVERTVKEVLPALDKNREQLNRLVDQLNDQLMKKGKDINEYREKYNIRVRGEVPTSEDLSEKKELSSQGVLVAKDS